MVVSIEPASPASAVSREIIAELETGIHQYEAIRLYEGMGFTPVPPFGEYRPDPFSVFYERHL